MAKRKKKKKNKNKNKQLETAVVEKPEVSTEAPTEASEPCAEAGPVEEEAPKDDEPAEVKEVEEPAEAAVAETPPEASESADTVQADEAPEPEAAEERRQAYRLNKVLGATIEHQGEVTKARLFIIDISSSGFRATNHSPLPEDDEIKVSIALVKDQEPLVTTARIVWQKELTLSGMFQLGCEFTGLDPESGARLEEFIAKESAAVGEKSNPAATGIRSPWTMIKNI